MKENRTNTNARRSHRLLYWLPAIFFMLAGQILLAQTKQVQGVVIDGGGLSVIGASVQEKGTTNGTITDIDLCEVSHCYPTHFPQTAPSPTLTANSR